MPVHKLGYLFRVKHRVQQLQLNSVNDIITTLSLVNGDWTTVRFWHSVDAVGFSEWIGGQT